MVEKTAVFLDNGYIKSLNKTVFGSKDDPFDIDYELIGKVLSDKVDANLMRTYLYDCAPYVSPNPTEDEKRRQSGFDKFKDALKRKDKLELRLGKLKKYHDEDGEPQFEQKGVDTLIAIDAVKLSLKGKINKAVFLTGDSDFAPVIDTIKEEGTETILFYHPSSVHDQLLKTVDESNKVDKELWTSFEH